MNTCTAPLPATCPGLTGGEAYPPTVTTHRYASEHAHWRPTMDGGSRMSYGLQPPGEHVPAPQSCEGTDWPPMTSWQRYAAERREGVRVPPSVSVWRPQDVRRQARSERRPAPTSAPVVAWGPGPGCEDGGA